MLKACCISKEINMEAVKILRDNKINTDVWSGDVPPTEKELKELIKVYDILIIGIKQKIKRELFEGIRTHKIIGTLSIGKDHIDEESLDSNLVDIVNCPKANVTSVAEHIFALILGLSKKIQEANDLVVSSRGDKKLLSSSPSDLSQKTIGLIGAGNISRKVIEIANVFQMSILCNTLHLEEHKDLEQKGVRFVELDELLQKSDIVSVNVPLTEQTRGLISSDKIPLFKENAMFINTSRGEIADVEALIKHADNNPDFYLGFDIDTKPYEEILSKKRNNVIATPHIAGNTKEASDRMYIECAQNIVDVLQKRREKPIETDEER